ncbi:MAG: SpoIIE family protein phosphatase [candidate division Zixibacteria bacterium]|nr:SpoIIE family protein phosphatase [candidate division Zixibacteria bacterium]MDH3938272.1 SpoIIE family protein phosphatase [candidate division Zixibacteria bacterium]MDH4032729.1 SpoIIE family protein phosphatase [candidate division Zixibacteria bacterium]
MSAELLRTLCYFLTGGFLIFLAITITRDNFRSRLNRISGAMLFFAGLGPLFMAMGSILASSAPDPAVFENSLVFKLRHLWEFFFPLLLVFSWQFPFDRMERLGHRYLRLAIFLPPLAHLVIVLGFDQLSSALNLFDVASTDEGLSSLIVKPLSILFSWLKLILNVLRGYEQSIFSAVNLIFVGAAGYFLETGKRHVTNPRIFTQTKWVMAGMRVGLGLFAAVKLGELLAPRLFTEPVTSTLLVLALLSASALLIFATIRHQFLDVQMVFRQSFVNTITSALLVGVYIVVVVQSRSILAAMFGVEAEVISYGLIILLLLFFQPINNWIDDLIRSMFMRTRTDHRNVIERFSRQVISMFDPRKLRQIIEETFKTTLLVNRVYFVLYDDNITEYAVLPSDDYDQRIVVSRQDLMLRGINLLDAPTYYHSLSDYAVNSELATLLEERGVRMILPMKDADHLLGFVALTDKAAGYRYSSEDLNLLGVLSNQMVSALTNARLYVESLERTRLQEEINMARQIQLDLLPSEPPALGCSTICAHSTPSRTVGGDFYDFIRVDSDRIGMVIADASGKGMPAALMIAQTQAIIRSEVNNGTPIHTMLKNVNQQMADSTSSEKYVTLFYGELNTNTGHFLYANAGHNYPILARSDGSVELLNSGGTVIGALPDMEYESATVKLEADDMLVLFTDGLSEAMDESEVEYGEPRLRQLVSNHRSKDADSLMDMVLDDVRSHDPTYPPRDDTTMVALKMNGGISSHEQ